MDYIYGKELHSQSTENKVTEYIQNNINIHSTLSN